MPAYARRQIVDEPVVGAYHCVARCVRRAFLCGDDRFSGKNFDHRKVWLQERMETLAGIMAVDVLGFSVLSNHLHLLLRIRPDIAAAWTDEEVARRWWQLHPGRRNDGTVDYAPPLQSVKPTRENVFMDRLDFPLIVDVDRLTRRPANE